MAWRGIRTFDFLSRFVQSVLVALETLGAALSGSNSGLRSSPLTTLSIFEYPRKESAIELVTPETVTPVQEDGGFVVILLEFLVEGGLEALFSLPGWLSHL